MEEILTNGTRVYAGGEFPLCADALVLARFSQPGPSESAADLCAGCGAVALAWHDAGHRGPCFAVELSDEGARRIERAAGQPGCGHIRALCADVRAVRAPRPLDICAANPPFFTAGRRSPNESRALARHDAACTVDDVCRAARRLLRVGGRLCLCMRPERLADVFCAMRGAGIEPKRLQFATHSPGRAPFLALVEGRRAGGVGLRVEQTLYLQEEP